MPVESKGHPIYVQQDNAKPHLGKDDKSIIKEGTRDGWKIELLPQPPNSPDFNVLDLGFFNSIQSLQHKKCPNTIDELVTAVENAFEEQTPETLDNVFLSLQQAMQSSMIVRGGNRYKLQHMGKERLRNAGQLPISLRCDEDLISSCREYLVECTG